MSEQAVADLEGTQGPPFFAENLPSNVRFKIKKRTLFFAISGGRAPFLEHRPPFSKFLDPPLAGVARYRFLPVQRRQTLAEIWQLFTGNSDFTIRQNHATG
jgi:hypothetical protein